MFSIKKYLLSKGAHQSRQTSNKDEFAFICPSCGNSDDHCNFNLYKKTGGCFKCNFSVHSVEQLISALENIPLEEARKKILIGEGDKLDAVLSILNDLKSEEELIPEDEHKNADLPKEFELVVDPLREPKIIMPSILGERHYPEWLIEEYKIGFCREGDYAARLIVPVECKGMKSFVARRLINSMNKKFKNPLNSKHSQLLFNYDNIKDNTIVFICEGVFDVLRMVERGYAAVGTFGKKLSHRQMELLFYKKPSEVVCLYDGDALKQNQKTFNKLSLLFKCSYVVLPEEYDPDDIPSNLLYAQIAKRISMDKLQNAINLLKSN